MPGGTLPAYEVHAYTQCLHSRVAKIAVTAVDAFDARQEAKTELARQGHQPDLLTLVPVEVGTRANPFLF